MLLLTVAVDIRVPGPVVVLTAFLGLTPLLAAAALDPAATAGFATAAVACAAASLRWNGGGNQYAARVIDVALTGALAVLVAAVRSRREEDLRKTRHIAGVAQQALLPVLPDTLGPVGFATRYHSATHTAQVGGDFFDFVADNGRIRLILGDVSGKGIDAVTQAARVIRAFRQYGASEPDLLGVARRVDEYVTPFWTWEYYATATLIEITDAATVTVVSAGHPPPLQVSSGTVNDLPIATSLPLGLGPAEYATSHTWQPGDRILLYTDGLVEARNRAGEFLPRTLIDAALTLTAPEATLDALLAAVKRHAGTFNDDLALLLITNAQPSLQSADVLARA
jgi:phosphoserine phosphatase RsbU/P